MDRISELWRELYEEGGKDRIRELLELDHQQAKVTQFGSSLLHIAAGSGYSDEVKLLLDHGANVDLIDSYGDTPLHNGAAGSYPEICRMLLDRGASTTVKNRQGQTPIDCAMRGSISASQEDYEETVKVLKAVSEQL